MLKLITGALRIGVSARLAKTAVAALGDLQPNDIEEVWHGLAPPYLDLFAWVEGRQGKPDSQRPGAVPHADAGACHRRRGFRRARRGRFFRRMEMGRHPRPGGDRLRRARTARATRLYSRTGENVSAAFPDLLDALDDAAFGAFAIDGELLILREGRVEPFAVLQQRLNRKSVSPKLLADYPAHIRAYDLLAEDGEDLRPLPFAERRARLKSSSRGSRNPRIDLSPIVPFANFGELAALRADPRPPAPMPMRRRSKASC